MIKPVGAVTLQPVLFKESMKKLLYCENYALGCAFLYTSFTL